MNINPASSAPAFSGNSAPSSRSDAPAVLRQAERSPGAATSVSSQRPVGESQKAKAVDEEKLKAAIDKANTFVRPFSDSIQFSRHEDSGRMVVQVVDTQTKEVVRQIPSEEMLQISTALDKLQGLLIQNKA